jgi:hypothetical protein
VGVLHDKIEFEVVDKHSTGKAGCVKK